MLKACEASCASTATDESCAALARTEGGCAAGGEVRAFLDKFCPKAVAQVCEGKRLGDRLTPGDPAAKPGQFGVRRTPTAPHASFPPPPPSVLALRFVFTLAGIWNEE